MPETTPITSHEGKKYLRLICRPPGGGVNRSKDGQEVLGIEVDVYAVCEAFGVRGAALTHCVKKLLCAGQRGKGSYLEDLVGALAALNRAIEQAREDTPASDSPASVEGRMLQRLDGYAAHLATGGPVKRPRQRAKQRQNKGPRP